MTTTLASPPTVDTIRDTVIEWRRYLHRNPELSFHEEKTSQWVADRLAEIGGLEVTRPTPTSVLARLIGSRPGPVLAIRADIDALPIVEKNTHDFVSASPGVMHACGHDGHTSMLLGAVAVLDAVWAVCIAAGCSFGGYKAAEGRMGGAGGFDLDADGTWQVAHLAVPLKIFCPRLAASRSNVPAGV